MAVAGGTLSTIGNLLKTQYIERLDWLWKRKHVWLAHIKRNVRSLSGNVFTHPAMTAGVQGIGPGPGTADLPTPGNLASIVPQWSPRPHRGRIRVFCEAMYATKAQSGAFLRAWAAHTNSLIKGFMADVNHETLGNGTGALAYIEAAQNSTTVNVKAHQGPRNSHLIAQGMLLDLIDAASNSTQRATKVEVRSRTKSQIVLDSAPSGSGANDYFVRHGGNVAGRGYFFDGLRCIVDTADPPLADHGGLDRDAAANDYWKAQSLDFHSAFSLDMFDELYDSIAEYTDAEVTMGLTRQTVLQIIARELWEQVRYRPTDTLETRWKAIPYNGKPIYADPSVWHEVGGSDFYWLDMDTFEFMEVNKPGWMDMDGAVAHRVTDKEAYEATFTWHATLACHAPNQNARGYNIAKP